MVSGDKDVFSFYIAVDDPAIIVEISDSQRNLVELYGSCSERVSWARTQGARCGTYEETSIRISVLDEILRQRTVLFKWCHYVYPVVFIVDTEERVQIRKAEATPYPSLVFQQLTKETQCQI